MHPHSFRSDSAQIDRPVGMALALALGAADAASGLLLAVHRHPDPRWRAAAAAATAVAVSLGAAAAATAATFFLPVVLAAVAAAAALAPAAVAVGWVLACTGPACEQLWRPLLVRREDGATCGGMVSSATMDRDRDRNDTTFREERERGEREI